jgi:hypothetical protein
LNLEKKNENIKQITATVLQDSLETQKKNKDLQIWNKDNFKCIMQKHISDG